MSSLDQEVPSSAENNHLVRGVIDTLSTLVKRDFNREHISEIWSQLRTWRHPSILALCFLWLTVILGNIAYYKVFSPLNPDLFNTNDWLINYDGGFVRRGLIGQLLIQFHNYVASGSSLIWLLFNLQIFLYLVLAILVTMLALTIKNNWTAWIILSPGALLFTSYNLIGGYRKELVLFISLGLIALAHRMAGSRIKVVVSIISSVLYVVLIFSWEASILFLPIYLVFLFRLLSDRSGRYFRYTAVVVTFVSTVGFIVQFFFQGNQHIVSGICSSLSNANVPYGVNCLTNGQGLSELGSLTLNLQIEISRVGKHWPGYAFYFVWLGLCCIPFALSGWIGRNRLLFIAIMASIFPLCFIGSDYGRWVHIALMTMTLSWLMTAKNMESNVEGRGSLATIGLMIWATCWSFSFWAHPFLVGGFWNVLDLSGALNNFKQYLP